MFDSEKWDNEIARFGGIYISEEDRKKMTDFEKIRQEAEEWASKQQPVTVVECDYIITATAIVFKKNNGKGWSVSFRMKGNEFSEQYAGSFGWEEEPTKERIIKTLDDYFAFAE